MVVVYKTANMKTLFRTFGSILPTGLSSVDEYAKVCEHASGVTGRAKSIWPLTAKNVNNRAMKEFLLLLVLSLATLNTAYIITVDSHAEECFFDSAQAGAKLGKFRWRIFRNKISLMTC